MLLPEICVCYQQIKTLQGIVYIDQWVEQTSHVQSLQSSLLQPKFKTHC